MGEGPRAEVLTHPVLASDGEQWQGVKLVPVQDCYCGFRFTCGPTHRQASPEPILTLGFPSVLPHAWSQGFHLSSKLLN